MKPTKNGDQQWFLYLRNNGNSIRLFNQPLSRWRLLGRQKTLEHLYPDWNGKLIIAK